MAIRRLALLLALITASCGGDDAAPSLPSDDGATTTGVAAPADSSPGTPTTLATASTTAVEATTTTRDPGAAGTVDLDFLLIGPGASFVPLDDPVMVPAAEASWLAPDEIVLGVVHPSGEAHAFSASMMAYHHIANTTIAGEPYLVTY